MCQTKFCRACEKSKSILEFHKKQGYPDKRYPRCKECVKNKTYLPEKTFIVDNKKKCSKCGDVKDISCFSKRVNRKSGIQSMCKICKNSFPKNRCPKKRRNSELLKSYGISTNDFEKLLSSQNNCCGICGINQDDLKNSKKKYLCVDHSHTTGKIRGLLCDKCNRGIGLLGDSFNNLLKAADYLQLHLE
jgi:hypothetical protein